MTSSLGIFDFLTMSRRPVGPAPKIVLESRPGIHGFSAWNTGVRGEVQTIETLVDSPNLSTAKLLAELYRGAVGAVVPIMHAGEILPYAALILSVDPQPEPIVLGVGGLSGISRATLKATWQILTR